MTAVVFTLEAADSWFFRDGTPFGEGIVVSTGIRGTFPPPVQTLQGAIRTGLALANGWPIERPLDWPHDFGAPEGTGSVQFVGPFVVAASGDPLWPVPRIVWQDAQFKRRTRLRLSSPRTTDLGVRRLPRVRRGERLAGGWVTTDEVYRVLADPCAVPDRIFSADDLYCAELHVGVQRQDRRVKDGGLYVVHHARPLPGVRVGLVMRDCPADVTVPDRMMVRLGGEGRAAAVVATHPTADPWPARPELVPADGVVRYFISLLTDAGVPSDSQLAMEGPAAAPGHVVSASIGASGRVGGYDLQARAPRPLRTTLPAGTTWFMEADEDNLPAVQALHATSAVGRRELGEGWMVVGRWEEEP